jgi:hypothetical protein
MIEPAREKFTRRDPHLAKYTGLVQANPFEEHGQRYSPARNRRSINEMAPWVHAARPFFAITMEIVHRIGALFEGRAAR